MEYIERSITPYIKAAADNFKAVLVTGARHTGKTTLLRTLFPDSKYVSFDDPFIEDQAVRSTESFMSLNRPPVAFDEIHRVPELLRYIKMECDSRYEYGLYCLTGSQSFESMGNVTGSLSGRVSVFELSALSLREIRKDPFSEPFLPTPEYVAKRGKTAAKPGNIWQIIHRGGYPELYGDPAPDWRQFYADCVRTYLEREAREMAHVKDPGSFLRFMTAVASRTGQVVNYSDIARETGRDPATIRNWIRVLEATGIIYLLKPCSPSVLKRGTKTPKVYFRDTGLVSYLTGWLTPETLEHGSMAANMFETFAVSEILKSYSNQGIDYRYCVSYYRERESAKDGEEKEPGSGIDLIIEENGTLYPVNIKKGSTDPARAAGSFRILDKAEGRKRGKGAVISLCPAPGMIRENVLELPVWYI
ncbi:MAG: ATP-binding protein [Eubacteriaceae bacterium]|nr:ATP-binding protein [Eubacteriaceae bacterium]